MRIESIGCYVPQLSSVQSLVGRLPPDLRMPLGRLTGVERFGKAAPGEYSISLAARAVGLCMESSKYGVRDIDAVISCNISNHDGHRTITCVPSTAVRVAARFSMCQAHCFDIKNACAGLFTGLYVAKSLIARHAARRILIVSGEYITALAETALREATGNSPYSIAEMMACLTLGDSAVAMVVDQSDPGHGFIDIQLRTLPDFSDLCTAFPTVNGPLMLTQSAALARHGVNEAARHLASILRRHGWDGQPIRLLIPHQTADRSILEGIRVTNGILGQALFDRENTAFNLKNRGNTSTTSHFVALTDYLVDRDVQEGDRIVFSIAASGITVGTALYVWKEPSLSKARTPSPDQPALSLRPMASGAVHISNVAVVCAEARSEIDTFSLVGPVIRDVLGRRSQADGTIGLLVFTGIHRSGYLCEPALASMILPRIGILPKDRDSHFSEDLLCFDVSCGALGTQTAIEVANDVMHENGIDNAMIVAAETTHEAMHPLPRLPIVANASAMLVARNGQQATYTMAARTWHNYFEYVADHEVAVSWKTDKLGLIYNRCEFLEHKLAYAIRTALRQFCTETGTTVADYDLIGLAGRTSRLSDYFAEWYPGLSTARLLMGAAAPDDTYTSQLADLLVAWDKQARDSRRMLVIQVAAGIQVHISVWGRHAALTNS